MRVINGMYGARCVFHQFIEFCLSHRRSMQLHTTPPTVSACIRFPSSSFSLSQETKGGGGRRRRERRNIRVGQIESTPRLTYMYAGEGGSDEVEDEEVVGLVERRHGVREFAVERAGRKKTVEKTEENTRAVEGARCRRARSGERRRTDSPPRRVAAFASSRGQRSSTFAPECPW
ncbi:hypothetical protein PUN28_011966 [Cardiocondyla obscurior]|uniref:Uncharacterized protein n=1 Tax=Cardiocondyla obscurior TaxID=286306 RepID=A0AAW2F9V8_9HYME